MNNLHNIIERKFIESFDITDYEILTDSGWEDIECVNKTIPYEVFRLVTTNHELECADTHIVFDENMNEVFIEDIHTGDLVKTDKGTEKVLSVEKTSRLENMYDIQVGSTNHRYYTNGILSHNSTTYSIYLLWQSMFFPDKKIAIAAHQFATAEEILSRIKLSYEYIPKEIKPSVVAYSNRQVLFDNNSEIRAFATGGNSLAGFSCVIGSTKVTIVDDFGGVYYTVIEKVEKIADSSKAVNNIEIDESGMKKYNFVYKTVNNINGKEYIGIHSTDDLDDGYLGSGNALIAAVKKYGPKSFTRSIIKMCDTREEAVLLEAKLVDNQYIQREDTYNLTIGGGDAPVLCGEKNGFYGKHHSNDTRKRMKEAKAVYWTSHESPLIGYNFDEMDDVIVDGIRYNSINDMSVKLKIWQTPKIMELLLREGNGFVDPERQEQLKTEYAEYLVDKEKRHQHHVEAIRASAKDPIRNKKLSDALKGKPHWWQDKVNKNPEKIRKMAEKHRGMKRSDEARRHMSEGLKKFYAEHPVGNKGKILIINIETKKHRYIAKNEPIPEGWRRGSCKS